MITDPSMAGQGQTTTLDKDEVMATVSPPDAAPPCEHKPENRLRSADPETVDSRNTMAAGTVFMVTLGALVAAALLNAEVMLHRAETSELGMSRDIALTVWRPLEAVSSSVGLGQPRAGIDALRSSETNDDGFIIASAPPAGYLGHRPYREKADTERLAGPSIEPSGTATPLGLPPPEADQNAGAANAGTARPAAEGVDTTTSSIQARAGSTRTTRPRGSENSAPPPSTGSTVFDDAALLRQPTVENPLRVLLIGDSTMDAVGNSILRDLADSGLTSAQLDVRVSTGLSRPDFFDWPTHLREVTALNDTELVIVMIGANDAQPFMIGDSPEAYGTPAWFDAYRRRVASLLTDLTADGDWVLWIGQPIMRNLEFDAKMRQLNQIYVEELNRYPTATYINPRPIMSDEGGAYAAYLEDGGGNRVLVRQSDGMHLTPDGGDRLAPLVIAEIDALAPLG